MGILASLGDQRPGCGCSSGSDKVLSGNPSAVDAACLHQREDLGLRLFPGEDERLLWEGGFASPALELCRAAGCSAPAACVGDSWTSECSPAHLGLPPGTTSSASSSGKVTHLWDSHLRSLISRRLSHFSFVLQAKTKGLSVICLESL